MPIERRTSMFTQRERQAFEGLYSPTKPVTLDSMGQELGLTKERMRQLSNRVFHKITERHTFLTTRSRPHVADENSDLVRKTTPASFRALTQREIDVIVARYLSSGIASQENVGRRMGISKARVSQLEINALRKLRKQQSSTQ